MKKGFTLAESLIILGIIGVVSSLTIPTIIAIYQQEQTVTQLKKTYSVLQQAVRMASDEYGDCEGWDYKLEQNEFMTQYFVPYIKLSKVRLKETYTYRDLLGVSHSVNKDMFVLIDGTIVYYYRNEAYQNKNFILVDLNGDSKPNRLGRDVFAFSFHENILTVYTQYTKININNFKKPGNGGTSGQCNRNAKGGVFGPGSYCSTVIMANNCSIPIGYPWK